MKKILKPTQNAGNLTDFQLHCLDEFTAAAKNLNESGVSLVYDENNNSLHVVNRDMMKDCEMFNINGELPENAVSVSDAMTSEIENIKILPLSKEKGMYYYPVRK